jgi:hypothetical protein
VDNLIAQSTSSVSKEFWQILLLTQLGRNIEAVHTYPNRIGAGNWMFEAPFQEDIMLVR